MVDEIFTRLGVNVTVKINNRKVLSGIAEIMGVPDKLIDITVAIDKMEKIGQTAVIEELKTKNIPEQAIQQLVPILSLSGNAGEKLNTLTGILASSTTGMKGLEELHVIFSSLQDLPIKQTIEIDLSLARGLNYYTGAIFEVKAQEVNMGSICGGGRYDDLTGIFGLKNMSGVGISFGADRIFDVLATLDKFPTATTETTKALCTNLGTQESKQSLIYLQQLRNAGIAAEMYPDHVKLKKQMAHANKRNIPYVIIVGEEELQKKSVSLKNMQSGVQETMDIKTLLHYFNEISLKKY
jgi:histidyl-tRNA synthetase